ncbi:(4Fe-4S)-binding protein [Brevibacillus ginsengisoli]|uniref:(4Fe-4S)-binding protein n=1 Tax=Brevibacillus ginsengisoli TaxID=363854 RepID=UPI003CF76B0A
MNKKVYKGEDIEIYFDSEKCIHSGVCVKGMPEVFDLSRRPWVNATGSTADKIAAHIDTCPSGALTYKLTSKPSDKQD